jgi:uncharacterized protein
MVHIFSVNGINLAYDGESGNLFEVDAVTALLLKGEDVSGYSQDDIAAARREIESLKKEGLLFTSPLKINPPKFDGRVKSLCVHISHDCNMRCGYCFGGGGSYHGKRENMPENVALAAVDFLIEKGGGIGEVEMDFFGGEPMLNFDTLKKTVRYARGKEKQSGKKFKFTVTTNALVLSDEAIDFFNAEMDNVVLSIDGTGQTHDRLRKSLSGGGTYQTVLDNAKKFRAKRGGKDYYIRGTYTSRNPDFCKDAVSLADSGFDQISLEPVALDASHPLAIKKEHLPKIFAEYEKLADIYIQRRKSGKWFNFFHFMLDLKNAPCAFKRLNGCGAGSGYLAVSPGGELFPCHRFVGDKKYLMGNVFDKKVNGNISDTFFNSNLLSKPACNNCFAKYFCSGGCAAHNISYGGGIDNPDEIYCQIMKKRFECALYVYAAEAK